MAITGLGRRLREARKARKMTQTTLAGLAHLKQPSISELESGETKEISGPTLIAICGALRVRPEWLVSGKTPMDTGELESLTDDERELLQRYRAATARWKVSIRYMAALHGDAEQEEAAGSMNIVLAKIAATPVPDSKLGAAWTRPDKVK